MNPVKKRSMRRSAPRKVTRKKLPEMIPEEKFDWKEAGKAGIVFWCQECKEVVPKPEGKVGAIKCPKCGKKKIIFGTQKSVQNWTARKNEG